MSFSNEKLSLKTDYDQHEQSNSTKSTRHIEIRENSIYHNKSDTDSKPRNSDGSSRSSTRLSNEKADKISVLKKTIKHSLKTVNTKLEDQNFMQTKSLIFQVSFESYKAITASLLILFVTQSCSGSDCSIEQNLYHSDYDDDSVFLKDFYTTGLVINFLTLFVFIVLYIFEIKREIYLIRYLEENEDSLNDPKTVSENLKYLDPEKLEFILWIEMWYKRIGTVSIAMYIINIAVSAFVVSHYSVGFYTLVSFLTLVLFILKKFIGIYYMIQAEDNIFLSSYMTNTLQYNDVDPDYRNEIPV